MAVKKQNFEGVKAVTPTFRASYLNIFTPKAYEEGAPEKYSVQMIFDKKKTDLGPLKKKMLEAAQGAWGKDKAKWPKNFNWPFRDGDDMPEDMAEGQKAIYAGSVYCNADSKNPPGVYDQKRNEIIDQREIFSGCYCRASLFMVPYQDVGGRGTSGRSGIKLYLQGIQLIEKGEPLGRANARDDFEDVESESGGDFGDADDDDGGF